MPSYRPPSRNSRLCDWCKGAYYIRAATQKFCCLSCKREEKKSRGTLPATPNVDATNYKENLWS